MSQKFGETVAEFCAGVIFIWYFLGYFCCELLRKKETDMSAFSRALSEYDNEH